MATVYLLKFVVQMSVFWMISLYRILLCKDVSQYLEKRLKDKLYSLCINESLDISGNAQLIIFIRSMNQEFTIFEDLVNIVSIEANVIGVLAAVDKTVELLNLENCCNYHRWSQIHDWLVGRLSRASEFAFPCKWKAPSFPLFHSPAGVVYKGYLFRWKYAQTSY